MSFEDSILGGGTDFDPQIATESLIRSVSPGGPPVDDINALNTDLGRKISERKRATAAPAPATRVTPSGPPDFSSQSVPPPEDNTSMDFTDQSAPPPLIGPPAPPEVKSAAERGKEWGPPKALSVTPTAASPDLLDHLANAKDLKPPQLAKLQGRVLREVSDRGLQMDYISALRRVSQGGDAAGEVEKLRPKFESNNASAAEGAKPGAFSRGFVTGMLKENPENLAETLEGLGHLAPDDFRDSLHSASKQVHDLSKLSPDAYKKRSGSMWDIKGLDDALTWAGETVGSGVASSVPSLATGVGGAVIGGRVGGRTGAMVGAMGGAAVPSAVQNYGDLYKQLKDEKVDPKDAARYAAYATPALVALDTMSIGPIITRLGGLKVVKEELARGIAKRVAVEAAKGTGREGITEAMQQAIEEATVSLAADKPFWTVETGKKVIEAGVGGALTGAAMGGASGIKPDTVQQQPGLAPPPPGPGNGPSTGTGPDAGPSAGPSSPEDIADFVRKARESAPPNPEADKAGKADNEFAGPDPSTMSDAERMHAYTAARESHGGASETEILKAAGLDPATMDEQERIDAVIRATKPAAAQAEPQAEPKQEGGPEPETSHLRYATLREYGYSDEDIDGMSPAQRKREFDDAVASGVKPGGAMSKHPKRAPKAATSESDVGAEATSPHPEAGAQSTPLRTSPGDGTRAAPIRPQTAEDVQKAQAAEPTPAQAEAGNYQHAHMELPQFGLTGNRRISIETGQGQERNGVGADGKPWSVKLEHAAYGRLLNTKGADGEHLDAFIGPHPTSEHVFVVDQHNPGAGFDEHKIMLGFRNPIEALHAYAHAYNDMGKDRIGHVTAMGPAEFKAWLGGDTTRALKPPASEPVKAEAGGPASTEVATAVGTPKETPTGPGAESGGSDSTMQKPAKSSIRQRTDTQKSDEPLTLLQFIAARGGLAPHPELDALDVGNHRVQIPGRKGFFGVIRPTGDSLDLVREAAEEAGYLRGEHNKTSTIRHLLDAMDEELNRNNPKRAEGEEGKTTKKQRTSQAESSEAARDKAIAAAHEDIAAEYADLPADLHAKAAEIMADERLDVDSAVEMAAVRMVNEDKDFQITADDITATYGEGVSDEIRPRQASEDGRAVAPAGDQERRPDQGQEAGEHGERVSDAGAERGKEQGEGQVADARDNAWALRQRGDAPDTNVKEALDFADKYDAAGSHAFADGIRSIVALGRDVTPATLDYYRTHLTETEKTAAGEQTVLPGAERIGQGEQAQRAADKPLKPKKAQRPADEGLFGDEKDQRDLLDTIETALGTDADRVAPIDIARAAEIMADSPGMDVATAFGRAVAETTVEQGFITEQQAEEDYGPEIQDVLAAGREGPSERSGEPEQERAASDEIGPRGAAQTGEPAGRGEAGEQVEATGAGAAESGAAAGRDQAARDEASDTAADRPAAEDADNAVVAPEGYELGEIQQVPRKFVHIKGGRFSAVARRLSPWSVERGYGDTPEAAQRDALRRLGVEPTLQAGEPDERPRTDGDGQAALEQVPSQEGARAPGRGDADSGAERSGESGAVGDRQPDAAGLSGPRGARGGTEPSHPSAGRKGAGRTGSRTGGKRARVSEQPAGDEPRLEAPEDVAPEEAPTIPAANFRITDEVELGRGSEGEKFKDNIAAIRILHALDAEQRRATPAEQKALARYVGWGGLANAFRDPDGNLKPEWKTRGEELETLLSKSELASARNSTQNAHYTSKTVVDAMWAAAKRLGFKGGLSLETSAGVGNFIGLIPEDIAGTTRFIAIEKDGLTARIAKALYPQETVLNSPLEKVPLPPGEAVLNIGNPPFGSVSLRFQHKPELSGLSIHNQFFLAGLDALKPGGLQIAVVSHFLMDAKENSARKQMALKAELLGAIRLPDTAFKENARTEVVTDILFLQRRTPEAEADIKKVYDEASKSGKGGVVERAREAAAADIPAWVGLDSVRDPLGGEPMEINRYFVQNPHMVLGNLERSGTMYGKDGINVKLPKGADLSNLLHKAIARLPQNALDLDAEIMSATLARHKGLSESLGIALAGHETGHVERTPEGNLTQVVERETPSGGYEPIKRVLTASSPWSRELMQAADGRWYRMVAKLDEKGTKVKAGKRNVYEREYFADNRVPAKLQIGQTNLDRLGQMVDMRDQVKRQLTLEAQDAPVAAMEANRKKLAATYQKYVKENGLLNEGRNVRLANDLPDGALVLSLETGYRAPITVKKAKRTGETARPAVATPAPILSRRVVPKYEPATRAANPQDALSISLAERGKVDMGRIAQLLSVPEDKAIAQLTGGEKPLVYKDPETGAFETRDAYLSGKVAQKLKAAEAAGLVENVKALEKVQPEKWTADQVTPLLGSNWIPRKIYADFAKHLLGAEAKVQYSPLTNSFGLHVENYAREKMDQWGTADMPPDNILRGMLNSRVPKVMREDGKGNRYVDQDATALVGLKAAEIHNEFADWVFADGDRRNKLVEIYNDKFNTRVNRQDDGSHLTLPGKVPDEIIRMRRHQMNAIWRGIHERFMLLDHVVGAGKTFTAIARVMERRRMGLSRKPMIAVPNHLVDQWTSDFYKLYPSAKVLSAGKNQFDQQNRRRLFAKIATGDWDAVIVPHSSFGFIGISAETETRFLEEELRIAKEAVKEAADQAAADGIGGRTKPFTVKQAEALVTKIEGRLDGLKKRGRDNMLSFEQMGVDDLTVDEAHEFKNLFYSSRLTGVRGMGDSSGSQKAFDLYNKVRVLRESPAGTVTFMTGTPISNSAVEMYTMMRYLAADDLKELGIENFDAWRTQSVSATPKFEPTEAGGLKEVTRLGRSWSNMRSLMDLYYSFTDAVSQEDIDKAYAEDNKGARFPVPKIKHGGRKEVVVKPTPAQSEKLNEVIAGFNNLPNISDPNERNAARLRLMDQARKVSLDVRAADRFHKSKEVGGKLDKIADNVARIYKATEADAGTQLIFLDRSVPASKSDAKIIKEYDDLIEQRDQALAEGNDKRYRELIESLDKFDHNEIEELKAAQGANWNAYAQLKENLIKRGLKPEEIRFVQEANNDAEKKALFDSVNDGEVRVLIGSTPRMGAGTNVQERLVALHHGDVTWKPSDIEQREGRIIRQGNRLLEKYGPDFEAEILAYVTERTVDAKMWDLNSTKLKMINGIRKYSGDFNMEFEDEDSVGMAEIAALASGDPLLLERVKTLSEIDKLELLERAHRRKLYGLDDTIQSLERAERQYPRLIEQGKAKAKMLTDRFERLYKSVEARSVVVEGKKYTTRAQADAAVAASIEAQQGGNDKAPYAITIDGQRVTTKEAISDAVSNALGDANPFEAEIDGKPVIRRSTASALIAKKATGLFDNIMEGGPSKSIDMGRMLGFELTLTAGRGLKGKGEIALTLSKGGETLFDIGRDVEDVSKPVHVNTAHALLNKLEVELDRASDFTSEARYMQERITEAEQRLPKLREDRKKPFDKADELQAKRDRLEDIIKTLDARTKAAESRTTAPAEPEVGEESDALASLTDMSGLTPDAQQSMAEISAMLRRIVGKIAGDVPIEFHVGMIPMKPPKGYPSDLTPQAGGVYHLGSSLVKLALLPDANRMAKSAFHESYHHVEDKLQTPQERRLMAAETERLRERIKGKTQLSDEQVDKLAGYEVRAIAFQNYAHERATGNQKAGAGAHIGVRMWFNRLLELLQKIRNALRGMGFKSYEDVFNDAYEGRYADREPGKGGIDPNDPLAAMAGATGPNDPVKARLKDLMLSTKSNRFVERYQNLSEPVKRLQEAVEARANGTLPDSKAFYTKKRLFPGKVGVEVQDFNKAHLDPLIDYAKSKGLSLEQVGDIAYALHAPEANAELEKINHPALDGSDAAYVGKRSGMSDEEAAAILAAHSPEIVSEIDHRLGAIRDFVNSRMVAAGLESKGTIEAWNDTFKHYVPLSGWAVEPDNAPDNTKGVGNFNVRGPEVKRRFGRKSRAANPLVNILDQAYRTIERAERNEYVRSAALALGALDESEQKGFVRFDRGEPKKTIDPRTGLVRTVENSAYRNDPAAVGYKVGGNQKYLIFENRELGEAIKRMHPDGLGMFQPLLDIQNKIKAMWTHYSPEFLVRHFLFRYPIEGTLNSFEQGAGQVPKYIKDAIPFLGHASKAIFAHNKGTVSSNPDVAQMQQYYREMREHGGSMTFRSMRDQDLLTEHLKSKLNSLNRSAGASIKAKHQAMIEAMDAVTNALDNSLRLAAYAAARRSGKTPEQAALIARDATVDFQLSGKWKNAIGLIFPFGNIAIQTGVRMTSAVARSRIMRRVFMGTMLAGFLAGMFNYLVGGDDEDGIPFMDKIPEWERRLNFTVMNPFHRDAKGRPVPIHIPMPYNWAFPLTLGHAMATMAFGKDKHRFKHMLGMMTKSGLEVLTPFGQEENLAAIAAPELARPFIHAYTNKNYNGVPVHRDAAFQRGPSSESGRKTTGDGWKYIASAMNTATGGDKRHSGALDFYPEDYRLMFDYVLGSQRRFVDNSVNSVKNAVEGKDTDYSRLPLSRVIMGTDYDAADRARRYERIDAARHPWKGAP